MAKEPEKKGEHKGGAKAPKHKLKSIHTHVAEDGSFVHEHHYEDHKGHPMPPRFGGVSEDMNDLHQHMDDHLGDGADADAQGGAGASGDAGAAGGDPGAAGDASGAAGGPGGAPAGAGAPGPDEEE